MVGFIIPTVEEVISSRKENSDYSEFRFPDDLGPHAIVLNFSDYTFDRAANTVSTVTTSSICLPLPQNLVDSFSLSIGSEELGALGDLGRTAGAAAAGSTSVQEAFTKIKDSGDISGSVAVKAIKSAIASADSSVVKGFEAGFGTIINPHVALTFNGIELKTHQFDWMFAPTSASESMRLAKILKTIKRSILPTYRKDQGRTFLNYPKVVDIFFLGTEPGHMYFFKRCMVSAFTSNYAAAPTPAFLAGGKPAFVSVQMSLREMEIHTADDYAEEVTK